MKELQKALESEALITKEAATGEGLTCEENDHEKPTKDQVRKGDKSKEGAAVNAGRNYTYMLRCADGSLYTGWTNDLDKRVKAHQAGKGAKYTSCHLPVELVYYECFEDKKEAMRREYAIKQLKKEEKEALVMRADNPVHLSGEDSLLNRAER